MHTNPVAGGAASAVAARAALESARGALGSMTAAGGSGGVPAAAAEGGASGRGADDEGANLESPSGRALVAWRAAETVLRAVTGRRDLTGQALVGEARRTDHLTLGDAHVLVALYGWMERQQDPANSGATMPSPPSETERGIAREALLALEHAVATVQRETRDDGRGAAGLGSADPGRSFAPPGTPGTPGFPGTSAMGGARATSGAAGSVHPPSDAFRAPLADAEARASSTAAGAYADPIRGANRGTSIEREDYMPAPASLEDARRAPWYRRSAVVIGGAIVLLAAAGALLVPRLRGRDGAFREGSEAYARGSRETAKVAFARAVNDDPDDARPLIYLGRISREEGDLARAKRFLERAIRLAPGSALALREMAGTSLAQGDADLARRFYVRAIQLDPNDRLSQGFLACALHRLGRTAEAATWANRAGTGDWSPCLAGPPGMPLPPGAAPIPAAAPPAVTRPQ